jgi:alpha-beta hydrolase superfamily lysophospholipase
MKKAPQRKKTPQRTKATAKRPRPVYLMLRGLGREAGHWGAFREEIENQYEVYALDLPGAGSERHRSCPLTIDEIVDDIRERWLRIKEERQLRDTGLFAISLGGMIALSWISRYPGDFNRLILINSSSRLSPFYRRLRPASYPDFVYAMLTRHRERRENRMFSRTCNSDADRESKVGVWIRMSAERPLKRSTFFRQLWAASRFVLPEKIDLPALFLGASRDRLVHVQCSRDLAAHYGVDLIEHPWAGHDLTTDDGPWVLEQMKQFERRWNARR